MKDYIKNTLNEYKGSYNKEYFIFEVVVKGISLLNQSDIEESKVIRSDMRTFLNHIRKMSIYDEKNVSNVLTTIGERIIKKYKL